MGVIITCDSTIDLTPELIKKYDLKIIPLFVNLDEETFLDGETIQPADIYAFVEKTGNLPKTAARGIGEYADFFKQFLDAGHSVVHFSIGAKLSSSYSSAKMAVDEHKLENVFLVDTNTLSSGSGLLAMYASDLVKRGDSAQEIYEKCLKRVPYVQASFVVENLKFLHKGGRCSMLSVLGANLLRIKPCIQVVDGVNKVHRKYMGGINGAIQKYCADTLKEFNTPDTARCVITYSTATPEMLEAATKAVEGCGLFKEIYITQAGSVINSHCGKNTLGILYINDGEVNKDIL